MGPLNWNEAAAVVGKSRQAVQDLVRRGVLNDCVRRDSGGKPIGITSADDLRNEYSIKVRARAGGGGKEAARAVDRGKRKLLVIDRAPSRVRSGDGDMPDYNESRAKTEYEKSLLLELERREKEGQLVERAAVEATLSALAVEVRTKLRAVPNRARQRIPHLTPEEVVILTDLVDEALEALANG